MTVADWIAAVVTLLSVDALAIALLLDRRPPPRGKQSSWFDHQRFVKAQAEGVKAIEAYRRPVIVHPCSYGGDLIEYPAHPGFPEDDVLATLATIEAL